MGLPFFNTYLGSALFKGIWLTMASIVATEVHIRRTGTALHLRGLGGHHWASFCLVHSVLAALWSFLWIFSWICGRVNRRWSKDAIVIALAIEEQIISLTFALRS